MAKYPLNLATGDELYFTFSDIGVRAIIKAYGPMSFTDETHVYEYLKEHPEFITAEHELLWHMHLAARKADAEAYERKRAEDRQAQDKKAADEAWMVLVGHARDSLLTKWHQRFMRYQGWLVRSHRSQVWPERPNPDAGGVPEQREG